ncbi:MAG TPA: serine/threonine-protein kinase [Allosphingosinicella sp.]|nr:serine/threonine-protein kinase [Allosphingosinicella sp.]
MNEDKDKKPPVTGEERTIIAPGGKAPAEPPAAPTETPTVTPTQPTENFAPRADAVGIKVGDRLNDIFEVKKFLARGGMGEVFEGCNIHTDEKVAIKVMLPALAGDERVIAMFRKEARTLTKIHHEALVNYRVLAQEPDLHVLYIVTDFIAGTPLSAAMGTLKATPDDLARLLRRLAAGLASAHELGAIHRDISPDNVILENDQIDEAKIIDFGIAKDLEASSATIVGDGFAGKLNYVAPEQLGDFGREIGPWTDVYSLGLVILAAAQGRNVDMSGSLVDAIDKRRRGPDLKAVPAALRPLLESMLRPNPQERLRSMEEVLARLDDANVISDPVREPDGDGDISTPSKGPSRMAVIGIVLLLVLAAAAAAWYFTGGRFAMPGFGGDSTEPGNAIAAPPAPPPPPPAPNAPGDPAVSARDAIDSVLPSVSCTWLDIGTIAANGGAVSVLMRGVAGDAAVARDQIRAALVQAGLANPNVDFADVSHVTQAGCAALDAYRQIRAPKGGHLSMPRVRYPWGTIPDGPYRGRDGVRAQVDLDLTGAEGDIALLGIQPSGQITVLLDSRAAFERVLAGSVGGRPISREGDGRYRIHLDTDHSGWSGILLIGGRGPFDAETIAPDVGARDPAWRDRFLTEAGARDWSAEMVWYYGAENPGKR